MLIRHGCAIDQDGQDFLFVLQGGADFAHKNVALGSSGPLVEDAQPVFSDHRNEEITLGYLFADAAGELFTSCNQLGVNEHFRESGAEKSLLQPANKGIVRLLVLTSWNESVTATI